MEKGNRSKSAEIIQSILGLVLSKSYETRWNSLHDSLKQIFNIKEKSDTLHKALALKNLIRNYEYDYIAEFLPCAKPIARALDIFQGEK